MACFKFNPLKSRIFKKKYIYIILARKTTFFVKRSFVQFCSCRSWWRRCSLLLLLWRNLLSLGRKGWWRHSPIWLKALIKFSKVAKSPFYEYLQSVAKLKQFNLQTHEQGKINRSVNFSFLFPLVYKKSRLKHRIRNVCNKKIIKIADNTCANILTLGSVF